MALSTEEFNELVSRVKSALESGSLGVTDVPLATTLEGVNSLPALQLKGSGRVVLVPLKLLSDPVYEAIAQATPDFASYCKNLYENYVLKLLVEAQKYFPVLEDGWHFTDKSGNSVVSVTDGGLDAAKLGDKITDLIKSIPNIGIQLGVSAGTAYDGEAGAKLSADFNKFSQTIQGKTQLLAEVGEDGFFFVDSEGNIGACITPEGSQGMGGGGATSYDVIYEMNIYS